MVQTGEKKHCQKKGQRPVFIFSKKKLPEFGQYQPIIYQPKLNISVWFRRIRKDIIIKSIASMWSNLQACHFLVEKKGMGSKDICHNNIKMETFSLGTHQIG